MKLIERQGQVIDLDEASKGGRASRSGKRTRNSLVTLNGSGQTFRDSEANIHLEEMFKSTSGTSRGERRQRVRKEQPGTWERPDMVLKQQQRRLGNQ